LAEPVIVYDILCGDGRHGDSEMRRFREVLSAGSKFLEKRKILISDCDGNKNFFRSRTKT
jgi:hypothetical protein